MRDFTGRALLWNRHMYIYVHNQRLKDVQRLNRVGLRSGMAEGGHT